MIDERLYVSHRRAKTRAKAARTGRAALPTGIPGEYGEVGQIELGGQVRHAARMLVAAVKKNYGAARHVRDRRPVAVKEADAVVRLERFLFDAPPEHVSKPFRLRRCRRGSC